MPAVFYCKKSYNKIYLIKIIIIIIILGFMEKESQFFLWNFINVFKGKLNSHNREILQFYIVDL